MLRFSLFGIPVTIQPWFWITLAIIGGGAYADSRDSLLRLVLFMLAGLISILVHELGHALAGQAFGARSEIVLQAFGGFAMFDSPCFTRPQRFLVTAAGPTAQIVLGLATYLAIPDLFHLTSLAGYFWMVLAGISFIWAGLNLLPVLPLDGGQMVNSILGPARVRTTLQITIVTAIAAAAIVYVKFNSILFPAFLGIFAWQAWKQLR